MSLEMIVYLASVLPNISQMAILVVVPTIAIWIGSVMFYGIEYSIFRPNLKIFLPIIISCMLLIIAIPDKQTIYTMAGISVTKDIAQTPEAQKALKLINLGLDKAINNLQESK